MIRQKIRQNPALAAESFHRRIFAAANSAQKPPARCLRRAPKFGEKLSEKLKESLRKKLKKKSKNRRRCPPQPAPPPPNTRLSSHCASFQPCQPNPNLSPNLSPNLLPIPGNSDSRSSSDFPISWSENKKAYHRCG